MKSAAETLLPEAARPTVDATLEMAKGRSPQISRALKEIAENFFELDYQVNDLRRKAGGSDRFAEVFQRSVGLTPWRFIQECRMETAARWMLDATPSGATPSGASPSMEDVAFLVGYQSMAAFWRLSHRWSGMAPDPLRDQLQLFRDQLEALPESVLTWHFWCRCARGELTRHEVATVAAHLEQVLLSFAQESWSFDENLEIA